MINHTTQKKAEKEKMATKTRKGKQEQNAKFKPSHINNHVKI